MAIDWRVRSAWPAWVSEPVELVTPDPSWRRRGGAEAARLTFLLGDHAYSPVEHVGSTAVHGLRAKPILDFAVPSREPDTAAQALAITLGPEWVLVPVGLHTLPIRLLVRVKQDRRHTHLQIVRNADLHYRRLIGLRDVLRRDQRARAEYERAKLAAAIAHIDDRTAYTDQKAAVIGQILQRVGIEPAPDLA